MEMQLTYINNEILYFFDVGWIEIYLDNFNKIFFTSSLKYMVWLMSLGSYHTYLVALDRTYYDPLMLA